VTAIAAAHQNGSCKMSKVHTSPAPVVTAVAAAHQYTSSPAAPSVRETISLGMSESTRDQRMTPGLAPVAFVDLTVPRATEGGKSGKEGKAMEDKDIHENWRQNDSWKMSATNCENMRMLHDLHEQRVVQEKTMPSTKLKAWLYPKLYWGLPPRGNIREDGTRFLKVWDVLLAVSCFYLGFMVPFCLFFEKVYLRGGQCLFTNPDIVPGHIFYETRYVDVIVEIFFSLDMFFNFVTARWVLEAEPMEHWELYDDLSTIAYKYGSRTFILDVIASFPLQYIDCIPNVDIEAWKLLRLVRLLKLLRLHRLDEFFKMIHFRFPEWIYAIAVVKLSVTFLLVAHVVASAFFYMSYGLADPEGNEQEQYGYFNGWVFNDGILDEQGEPVKYAAGPWLSSFYWAVTTMSTIGYGDISATTTPERILGMLLMIVGCCFFAYITGNVTQLLSYKPACEQRFEDIVSDLETFMIVRGIPHALKEKLRNYYMVRYPSGRVLNDDQIIQKIESPFLRKDILIHLYKDLVEKVPVFALMDDDTKREIAFRLKNIYRMPGRIITEAKTQPDAFYIVRFGAVSLKAKGMKEHIVTQGDLFGEMALLGLTMDGLRMRTAKALSVVELCSLSAKDFEELLVVRPGVLVLVREVCKLHLLGLRDMYHRAVSYKSHSDEKDVPATTADHFHEATRCINWRAICEVIKENRIKEQIRTADSKVDEEEMVKLEKSLGVKLVKRVLRIHFSSLLPAGKIADATDQSGIIVAWWPGYGPEETARQTETGLFNLRADKFHHDLLGANKVAIHLVDEILLPILSPQGLALSKLPPVQIAVLIVPRKSSKNADLSRALSRSLSLTSRGVEMKLCGERGLRSKIVPSAQIVFQGSLGLSEINQRSKSAGLNQEYGSIFWFKLRAAGLVSADLPVDADTSVRASEYNPNNPNEAGLQMTINLQRYPRCPGWKKLIPLISANMATPFFVKNMLATVDRLEEKHSSVMTGHRMSRLANMRVYRLLNPDDSSKEGGVRDKDKGPPSRHTEQQSATSPRPTTRRDAISTARARVAAGGSPGLLFERCPPNNDSVVEREGGSHVHQVLHQGGSSNVPAEGQGKDVLQKLVSEIQSMKAMSMTCMAEIQSIKTSISDLRGEVSKLANRRAGEDEGLGGEQHMFGLSGEGFPRSRFWRL
jgi:CRP-like cAMP-binding protein